MSDPKTSDVGSGKALILDGGEAAELVILSERPVLPADKNPFLVYIGGLDKASRPTMRSTGRLVAATLSGGSIAEPEAFPWHLLTYAIVRRLRAILRDDEYAPATINKALTLVRNVVREAWLGGLASHEEYERICQIDNLESKRLPAGRVVERDEIAALLHSCQPETVATLRDAVVIALLAGAGLREKEAVGMLRGDFTTATGAVFVRQGKHHKQRLAALEPAYESLLRRFLSLVEGGDGDPLIPRLSPSGNVVTPMKGITTQSIHLMLEARARAAGVKKFTPHDLRRSFITHQLERGTDALRLARVVGHADPKTTLIYDRRTAESDRHAIRGEK